MTALNKQALREELSNPAIGSNHHMRKLALSLLYELESAERQNGYLREQRDEWERKAISNFEECSEMSARIEELESQRKLAFTASNRWADKFREAERKLEAAEKRIAELERYRTAFTEWLDKTEWVQSDKRFDVVRPLGKHRADVLREYIEHLEARKFKVEMPESFYPDGDIDTPLAVDELEVIAAIVEAGGKPVAFCKRCDREIDLTHRPDGSHIATLQTLALA